ncbi:FkbM family methyltransferase [uncultured Flavonifractor sp.]|uniref:FkbM family methyltransferase n=1 Tax=uncultured Flavonifractor sp. TaxID=1193534 RepID=UPI002635221B|nr:FkbM family methyltransferase [uncultured Flavonifractor sp.]
MSALQLEQQLERAFDSAIKRNSFSKVNLLKRADHICVFGLGKYFGEAFIQQNVRKRFQVDYLCDNNEGRLAELKQDDRFQDLHIISPNELKKLKNTVVIFMLGDPRTAIEQIKELVGIENCISYNDLVLDDIMGSDKELNDYTASKAELFTVFDLLADDLSREIYTNIFCLRVAPDLANTTYEAMCTLPQYFPQDIIQLTQDECFVDCGAYIGDTLEIFSNLTDAKFKKYYAFELDENNFAELLKKGELIQANSKNGAKVICYPYGVWKEDTMISYGTMASADSYSVYNPREVKTARMIKLDSLLRHEKVSFIKMDIEGSELEALKGAQTIIKEQRPKMAICVYHKIEDLWKIPLFLHKINPEYKIYIRHHAKFWVSETVCYAIP